MQTGVIQIQYTCIKNVLTAYDKVFGVHARPSQDLLAMQQHYMQ